MAKRAKKKATKKKAAKAKKAPKKLRCKGVTADGKRCKRMVTPPAKYCYLHKGGKKAKSAKKKK
ncbi:MAG: hypothetical protein GF310_07755 [candidate division Zixibacteria bacterium]|nr:hypothetical protein [candidate division Zixibacteria bacterium]